MSISDLPAIDADSGRLNVVIDTPKGSRNKYKFDDKQKIFRLSKEDALMKIINSSDGASS